jgi:hypothetical protein
MLEKCARTANTPRANLVYYLDIPKIASNERVLKVVKAQFLRCVMIACDSSVKKQIKAYVHLTIASTLIILPITQHKA